MNIYEWLVWLLYAGLYKYAYYLQMADIPSPQRPDFPHPRLILYAFALTLYIIPFYRWLAPSLLRRKRYLLLLLAIPVYFETVPKLGNYLVSRLFLEMNRQSPLVGFFSDQDHLHTIWLRHLAGWDLRVLLTDLIAFISVTFMRFAFENEEKRHLLEKDNLMLQLESLKAQLHPHFLFNTLNGLYGMSLAGAPETPEYILKLSDMMRYILYDCRHPAVPLEKDIAFLENYWKMEKKRYPHANIQLERTGDAIEDSQPTIAPLLLIPFVENSFKHGSHRITDKGSVFGRLILEKDKLHFLLENCVLMSTKKETSYGGVGIENVRRRLELYYPGRHALSIHGDQHRFIIELSIQL
jgi:hypothetical protein